MGQGSIRVIGHRGAAALAPENTWAGFDLALALGVDAIETDVRATRDGVLVLLHDERLDRTTDGSG
ncbi:MAG: glycerophosphodiester phosphodiesterase, partial [Anaerolineae bacterium]